jgi:hypothetical protein
MIVAIGIRPKAPHQIVVSNVARLGRDSTGKGCRRNFYERRRTEGLSVKFGDEAMLVAIVIRPESQQIGLLERSGSLLRSSLGDKLMPRSRPS